MLTQVQKEQIIKLIDKALKELEYHHCITFFKMKELEENGFLNMNGFGREDPTKVALGEKDQKIYAADKTIRKLKEDAYERFKEITLDYNVIEPEIRKFINSELSFLKNDHHPDENRLKSVFARFFTNWIKGIKELSPEDQRIINQELDVPDTRFETIVVKDKGEVTFKIEVFEIDYIHSDNPSDRQLTIKLRPQNEI